MNPPPKTIAATKEEIRALMKSSFKTSKQVYGFYNSHFDRIIKDEDLMVVPIYDRQVHRAHSIFDTVDVIKNRLILLDEHLARMAKSCEIVHIDLPMPLSVIREKIIDLASFCISHHGLENKNFYIRYWVSSGGDNFGILPSGNSRFYAVAFDSEKPSENKLYKEYTINTVEAKTGILAEAKTTNYLTNALVAMESKKKGGMLGIMLSKEGYILEPPISNVAFIWKNGDFVTPPFDGVLRGTTLIECMNYVREELVSKGIVRSVVQKQITAKDVFENAVEMIFIGGNYILPIGSLDDREISKEIGKVTKIIQENYMKRVLARAVEVPLNRYKKTIPNPKF